MNIWLERFVLVFLAAIAGATVLTNPWRLDRLQQATLIVAIAAIALFTGRTIERNRANVGVDGGLDSLPVASGPSKNDQRPTRKDPVAQPPSQEASNDNRRASGSSTPGIAGARGSAQPSHSTPAAGKREVAHDVLPSPQLPDLVVDDFTVADQTLRARMRLKNFGNASAEATLKIDVVLGGSPLRLSGERPDVVFVPAQATKSIDFGPLSPGDADAVRAGRKQLEVIVEITYGIDGKQSGYRYRGRYSVDRGQFDLIDEKRW
jgi:hypothetical protein